MLLSNHSHAELLRIISNKFNTLYSLRHSSYRYSHFMSAPPLSGPRLFSIGFGFQPILRVLKDKGMPQGRQRLEGTSDPFRTSSRLIKSIDNVVSLA